MDACLAEHAVVLRRAPTKPRAKRAVLSNDILRLGGPLVVQTKLCLVFPCLHFPNGKTRLSGHEPWCNLTAILGGREGKIADGKLDLERELHPTWP